MNKYQVGDRVRSIVDQDTGKILRIGGKRPDTGEPLPTDVAWVAWDQGVCTPCELSALKVVQRADE